MRISETLFLRRGDSLNPKDLYSINSDAYSALSTRSVERTFPSFSGRTRENGFLPDGRRGDLSERYKTKTQRGTTLRSPDAENTTTRSLAFLISLKFAST